MAKAWMVRAGAKGSILDLFLNDNVAAIGWDEMGDLSTLKDREQIRKRFIEVYPDRSLGHLRIDVGMLARFSRELAANDLVVTYDPSARVYHLGTITGPYRFEPKPNPEYPHKLPVSWQKSISRDLLSVDARNTLGAIQTLFEIGEPVRQELSAFLKGNQPPTEPNLKVLDQGQQEEDQLEELRRDTIERAQEFIKDKVQKLDWEEMQELVAGVLRALGYKTLVSPRGADQGKDIIASPDGLGLESPRIKVEVKHRKEQMGSSQVRSFIGGLRQDDRGLYISTGGFTREAVYEAERAPIPVTLVDLDRLVSLLVQHYEAMDMDAKALVPLVRVYWPAV